MRIREALAVGKVQLAGRGLEARLLLAHVLQKNHAYLIGHGEDVLTGDQVEQYAALLARAEKQEPIPYLVGYAPFYGREFVVSPAVLIPRPETEQLVEKISQHKPTPAHLVDVGTGSGCIAVTLACLLPQTQVTAVDVSPEALAVAQANARRQGVADRVQFVQGSLLASVPAAPDLIVANLPYITDDEWQTLDDGVKWYEPAGALRGGVDGLDLIQQLLQQATTRLTHGGAIFLEIGWQQGGATRQLAQQYFPSAQITLHPDYAGHDRMVIIQT